MADRPNRTTAVSSARSGRRLTIDLHTHSNCSDGTDAPADLVAKAAATGIDVLGLTDHDTTAGWAGAVAALPAGMTLVPGVEVSAVWDPDGTRIGQIRLPEGCANVCFGGPKRNRLFMAASKSLYAVYVNTRGAHAS